MRRFATPLRPFNAKLNVKIMDYLKEHNGERVRGDQDIFGQEIPDGSEIFVKTASEFEGFKCRIWAPEFHSLLLDSAISQAKDAEKSRKTLSFIKSSFDGMPELEENGENTNASFSVMQQSILAIYACVSAVESWANKTIHKEITSQLTYVRPEGGEVSWGANRIEKDASLIEKVFYVLPATYGKEHIKAHVTSRKRFEEIVSDRNTVIHLKNSPKINGKKTRRRDLSLKLLRRNALLIPKNTLSVLKLFHDTVDLEYPLWLVGNIGNLEGAEHDTKSI